MQRNRYRFSLPAALPLAALALAAALVGCGSAEKADPVEPGSLAAQTTDVALARGYGLLNDLVRDVRRVDGVLWIKGGSTSDPVKTLIRDIADTAGDAADRLEQFAGQTPGLITEEPALPEVERAVRERSGKLTQSKLLGSSGRAFEIELLISQIKATSYARNLARTLAERDADPDRSAYLVDLADRFEQLHGRAVALLE